MKHISTLALIAALLAPWFATRAEAQSAEDQARQVLAEARAHEDEQRFALAAQAYMRLYGVMSEAGLPRASVALWSAGNAWGQVPGKEREAIDALQRFLAESTGLTDDPQVRDWRSTSVTLVAEFEARATAQEASQPDGAPTEPEQSESRISPIGPIVMGVGGAALVAGVLIGAFSLTMDADFRDECDDLAMCPTRLEPQYDEMRAFSAAADVLLVAGGIVALGGLILTLTVTETSEGSSPTVAAMCSPTGCFGAVHGSWQ